MTAYAALLKGVNVGKGRRVPMADLRALLEGLGHGDVATLLNSGNAVFRARTGASARHAAAIAAAIVSRLGVDVPVIVKSAAEYAAIVNENPYVRTAKDPSRLLVAFTQDATALTGLAAAAELVSAPEQFHIGRHAAWLHCARGILESAAARALLGRPGRLATTRNWATTLKLNALLVERDT